MQISLQKTKKESSTKVSYLWLLWKKFIKEKVNQNLSLNNLVVPTAPIIAKRYIGASKYFFSYNIKHVFKATRNKLDLPIILPNNNSVQAFIIAYLILNNVSSNPTKTYLNKDFKDTNIISFGQLYDNDYYVILTNKNTLYL